MSNPFVNNVYIFSYCQEVECLKCLNLLLPYNTMSMFSVAEFWFRERRFKSISFMCCRRVWLSCINFWQWRRKCLVVAIITDRVRRRSNKFLNLSFKYQVGIYKAKLGIFESDLINSITAGEIITYFEKVGINLCKEFCVEYVVDGKEFTWRVHFLLFHKKVIIYKAIFWTWSSILWKVSPLMFNSSCYC